ncbi:hypothetical protein ABKN59_009206 [Abortiporus biennis]
MDVVAFAISPTRPSADILCLLMSIEMTGLVLFYRVFRLNMSRSSNIFANRANSPRYFQRLIPLFLHTESESLHIVDPTCTVAIPQGKIVQELFRYFDWMNIEVTRHGVEPNSHPEGSTLDFKIGYLTIPRQLSIIRHSPSSQNHNLVPAFRITRPPYYSITQLFWTYMESKIPSLFRRNPTNRSNDSTQLAL